MNARETMKALLDGKTIRTMSGNVYRLGDEGTIEGHDDLGNKWYNVYTILNHNPEIVEERHLTFKDAIQEMLNGKIVVCEAYPDRPHKFEDNRFLIKRDGTWRTVSKIQDSDYTSKWKVIE